ncbi:MAG: hypothetical protein IJH04_08765 [Eggerthellaceae bacterium]|nr:hypothetical protein [Eggerthellaceae bacterium]
MDIGGCQGRDKVPTLEERICPECGAIVEVFSTDTSVACDNCGFVVHNDSASCAQWCKYARLCVGDELYFKLTGQSS